MTNIQAALIGCGPRGNSQAAAYRYMPDAELVAICDIDEERLRETGERHGVNARYTDLHKMIETERPELVHVATRTDLHAELTLAALEHGVHVLAEKPISLELEEADRMVKLAAAKGVKLAICHNARYTPLHRYAKQLIADGIIGDLRMIHATGKGYYGPYDMMNKGTHGLDIVRHYVGSPDWAFAQVTANGRPIRADDVLQLPGGMGLGAGDSIIAHYHFPSGVFAFAEFFYRQPADSGAYGWDLIGTKGILSIRGAKDRNIWLYEGSVYLPEKATQGGWRLIQLPPEEETLYGVKESAATDLYVVRNVVDSIRENSLPASNGEEGRAVLEMMMATYASQIDGRRVSFPLRERRNPLRRLLSDAGRPVPPFEVLSYNEFIKRISQK